MPMPTKMHLPVLPESVLDEMNDEHYDPKQDVIDPTLLKLPAASLKGTFAKAYKILTEITNQIGWDTLLKYRSSVFVMEEEYRQEKNASTATIRGSDEGSNISTPRQSEDGASEKKEEIEKEKRAGEKEIKAEVDGLGHLNGGPGLTKPEAAEGNNISKENSDSSVIEKPEHTVMPEVVKGGTEDHPVAKGDETEEKYTHFQNKRLCERWLDNLFMVLYEVCRADSFPFISSKSLSIGPPCLHNMEIAVFAVQAAAASLQKVPNRMGDFGGPSRAAAPPRRGARGVSFVLTDPILSAVVERHQG